MSDTFTTLDDFMDKTTIDDADFALVIKRARATQSNGIAALRRHLLLPADLAEEAYALGQAHLTAIARRQMA